MASREAPARAAASVEDLKYDAKSPGPAAFPTKLPPAALDGIASSHSELPATGAPLSVHPPEAARGGCESDDEASDGARTKAAKHVRIGAHKHPQSHPHHQQHQLHQQPAHATHPPSDTLGREHVALPDSTPGAHRAGSSIFDRLFATTTASRDAAVAASHPEAASASAAAAGEPPIVDHDAHCHTHHAGAAEAAAGSRATTAHPAARAGSGAARLHAAKATVSSAAHAAHVPTGVKSAASKPIHAASGTPVKLATPHTARLGSSAASASSAVAARTAATSAGKAATPALPPGFSRTARPMTAHATSAAPVAAARDRGRSTATRGPVASAPAAGAGAAADESTRPRQLHSARERSTQTPAAGGAAAGSVATPITAVGPSQSARAGARKPAASRPGAAAAAHADAGARPRTAAQASSTGVRTGAGAGTGVSIARTSAGSKATTRVPVAGIPTARSPRPATGARVRTAPGTATGAAGAGRGAGKAAGSDKAGSSGGAVSEDEEEEEADATCRDIDDRERCGGLTIAGGDGTGKPQAPYDGVLSVVIFGASGDLASKKTFPALFGLYKRGLLPKKLAIVGAARSELSRAEFTKRVTKHFPKSEDKKLQSEFLTRCYYAKCAYDDDTGFESLAALLDELEDKKHTTGSAASASGDSDIGTNRAPVDTARKRILYLAVPPEVYGDIAQRGHKFLRVPDNPSAEMHVVVEKPFGHDLESARALNAQLRTHFAERELFRIDHYLAKEMVQNMTVLRFANRCFEPLWSAQHIDSVTIAFKEDFGIGERAGYFESTGIVHDVLQNHMLQMFSLFAMEPPVTLRAEDVRDEKVKLLRAVQPVRPEDIVVGQYVKSESKQTGAGQKQQNGDGNGGKDDQESSDRAAAADAQRAEGESYRAEPGVAADSNTPTFCALVLRVENARWSGVPFIMKCGKALNEGKTEIRIQFKRPANSLFHDLARDELVIKVKPDDSVYLKVCSKLPGLSGPIAMTELDFTVSDRFPEAARDTPEAYERLLWDVTLGDRSLFVRSDELMQSWRLVAPVTAAIEAGLKAGTGADGRVELTPTGTQLGDAGTKAAGSTSGGGSVRGGNGVRPMRLYAYKRGTRGPVEADALAARHGFETTSGMYSWVSPGERRQRAGAEKGDSGGAQGGKGGEGGK